MESSQVKEVLSLAILTLFRFIQAKVKSHHLQTLKTHMAMAISFPVLFLFFIKLAYSKNSEFVFEGFKGTSSNVSLNGASTVTSSGVLQLTNTSKNLIGRAFYSPPLHMFDGRSSIPRVSSFSTSFVFVIVPQDPENGGGHGLAFVLAPTKILRGARYAQYLGVLGPSNNGNFSNHVFIVEFDTVRGSRLFNDIDDNHVGIDINSMNSTVSEPASYYVNNTKRKEGVQLASGKPIQAWIEYDGVRKLVSVTISPLFVPKPRRSLLSLGIDLSHILKETMYVGFSSSTGKLSSSHYILGWSFRMNGAAQPLNPSRLPFPSRAKSSSKIKKESIGIGVGSSAATIILLGSVVSMYLYYLERGKHKDNLEDWELECSHRFPYKDLYMATKGFKDSEILGSGGFGCVYKGVLPATKEVVAIKKISHNSRQGIREFVAEVASLGRMRHKHLVHLHGWCKRKDDLLLVYDFMPNGSLDDVLFDDTRFGILNWAQRFGILKGIASALLYLHEEWEQVVVHRDVKANNVLLDANMNGRLGDFGLAKLYEHGNNPCTTRIVGTLGYIAPELSRTGKATTYCDVFSYGALLLEVACGRRPIDPTASSMQILLLDWVRECWAKGYILEAADPKLENLYVIEEMELVLKLGIICSQKKPEARPSMRQVTRYLDGSDRLPSDVSPDLLSVDKNESVPKSATSSLGIGVISSGSFEGGRF